MYAKTLWTKGEDDGYIFKYCGFVFYAVRICGVGGWTFFNVVLLAVSANKGEVNV